MKYFEIEHIIENPEWEEKLEELAKRCENINGWTEKELLQFAVQSMPMYKVWLMYLDDKIHELEQEKVNKRFWNNFWKRANKKNENTFKKND